MTELKKICSSPINKKIISFFRENPSSVDTSRGIATWLNHDYKEIERALHFLASQNILIPHYTGSTTAYAYTQDKVIIDRIEKILQKDK
jgi:DNA polymerase II small subunit/DNA polymerase delta subunit B